MVRRRATVEVAQRQGDLVAQEPLELLAMDEEEVAAEAVAAAVAPYVVDTSRRLLFAAEKKYRLRLTN